MTEKQKEAKRLQSKIDAKKKRDAGQHLVPINCKICKKEITCKFYKLRLFQKKGGKTCKECISKLSAKIMKNYKDSLSPEERIAESKKGRSHVKNIAESVKKQWQTIKSDPEYYKEFCKKRSDRMKKVWEKGFTQDQKDYILTRLVASHGKSRSIGSDNLKLLMQEKELYNGFTSEEIFHGFFPDEINHELKIIIEYYGDLYHCNPKEYKNPEEYITATQRTVGEQWARDRKRLAVFYKHGYTVIIIWESDFRKNPNKAIERIKNEINKKRNFT